MSDEHRLDARALALLAEAVAEGLSSPTWGVLADYLHDVGHERGCAALEWARVKEMRPHSRIWIGSDSGLEWEHARLPASHEDMQIDVKWDNCWPTLADDLSAWQWLLEEWGQWDRRLDLMKDQADLS